MAALLPVVAAELSGRRTADKWHPAHTLLMPFTVHDPGIGAQMTVQQHCGGLHRCSDGQTMARGPFADC